MRASLLTNRYVATLLLCCCVTGCTNNAEENSGNPVPNGGASSNSTVETTDSEETGRSELTKPYAYSGHEAEYLNQGWGEQERQQFYYLGQGSQLVPYNWFINLELPGSDELLKSDRHMASLGFITQPPSDRNPDGLPIGFVKDANPPSIALKTAEYKTDSLSTESDWLGLTCAACHTADLTYKGKVIRIDGGAAMTDLESFLAALAKSMKATASDDTKFAAFAKRVREGANGLAGAVPPREDFKSYALMIEKLVERNRASHPYGFARLDAFGAILNQITEVAIKEPENHRPSSAPVSFPFLWDTPHMDWVQWNSSAEIPIARNVGEVLGVFGHVELTNTPEREYASSARLDYLHRLEVSLRSLKAPPWPADHFGAIDNAKAATGKVLFAANCAKCHNTRNDEGEFEMTPPNEVGKVYIKTKSVSFNVIRTDPQMVVNFATRTAKPGMLKVTVAKEMQELEANGGLERIKQLRLQLGMPAPDFLDEVPAALLLKAAVKGVIKRYLKTALRNRTEQQKSAIVLDLRGGHPPGSESSPPNGGIGYRARPLNGVWATAPYLHNGSVPNLFQLLRPVKHREEVFFVGSREFDPVNVGFNFSKAEGMFEFDTKIKGNFNTGHEGPRCTQTKDEETGEWRDFRKEDEIPALIEYIKTLK